MSEVSVYQCHGLDGIRRANHEWRFKVLSFDLMAKTCEHCGLRVQAPPDVMVTLPTVEDAAPLPTSLLEYQIAGLLSTIDKVPSHCHPEDMLMYARLILSLIADYESEDAAPGLTTDELLDYLSAESPDV